MTANELYKELLKIKKADPNHEFIGLDLHQFGNVESQIEELSCDGRIVLKHDIIGSFDVIG